METKSFISSGRLILQLGDQLIKDEVIALVELIKNSYDADASMCIVQFLEDSNGEINKIIIEDDGCGMTKEVIENTWLTLGSDYKKKKIDQKIYSPKYGRLPLGEKGIGRLGLSKLGWKVKIVTKTKTGKEIEFSIDWEKFTSKSFLKDVNVEIVERSRNEKFMEEKEGTYIEISDLKNIWDKKLLQKVYKEILKLQSPFSSSSSFRIKYRCPNRVEILKDIPTIDQIMNYYLYKGSFVIEKNYAKIIYEFKPFEEMEKLERKVIEKEIPLIRKGNNISENIEYFLGSQLKLEKIEGNILIFDKSHNILKRFIDKPSILKSYLNENGGVKVFRDGTRIYDYGSKGDDWLEFDRDRVNFPGEHLSNSIILGAVELDRETSLGLEEKTNREGFIENETFNIFKEVIKIVINEITRMRNEDKIFIRELYDKKGKEEPVVSKINSLEEKIIKLDIEAPKKQSILNELKELNKEYDEVHSLLSKSAGQGLSLGIIIHELQKRIAELLKRVEEIDNIDIKKLTGNIAGLLNGYRDILKIGAYKKINIVQVISSAIANVEYRLKVHEIELINNYISKAGISFKGKEPLIISSIINILDNSIYWLEFFKIKNKKILIDVINYDGNNAILIVDNGKGLTISPELAIKPMVSGKDEIGIGLGLFIVSESMKAQKGYIDFGDENMDELPNEFKHGAKILLVFKGE